MKFIDTNYFLRFFIGEPEGQYLEAKTLFHNAATGKIVCYTSLVVFFEVYWVTLSFYGFDKEKVVQFLRNMLKMEFIKIDNKDVLAEAVFIYADTSFDLEDAYNIAYARNNGADGFVTFDKKLQKMFRKQKDN